MEPSLQSFDYPTFDDDIEKDTVPSTIPSYRWENSNRLKLPEVCVFYTRFVACFPGWKPCDSTWLGDGKKNGPKEYSRHLYRHFRKHLGFSLYMCGACGSSLARKDSFKRHRNRSGGKCGNAKLVYHTVPWRKSFYQFSQNFLNITSYVFADVFSDLPTELLVIKENPRKRYINERKKKDDDKSLDQVVEGKENEAPDEEQKEEEEKVYMCRKREPKPDGETCSQFQTCWNIINKRIEEQLVCPKDFESQEKKPTSNEKENIDFLRPRPNKRSRF